MTDDFLRCNVLADHKPNEIESIVEYQLAQIEERLSAIRDTLAQVRAERNGRSWLAIISSFKELLTAREKLDAFNLNIEYTLKNFQFHDGVDG